MSPLSIIIYLILSIIVIAYIVLLYRSMNPTEEYIEKLCANAFSDCEKIFPDAAASEAKEQECQKAVEFLDLSKAKKIVLADKSSNTIDIVYVTDNTP